MYQDFKNAQLLTNGRCCTTLKRRPITIKETKQFSFVLMVAKIQSNNEEL
jgi:hypothetical protein